MFAVEYDVVWFDASRWRAAMAVVKHLTKTEIAARGLEAMHGLRINIGAPMPQDSRGAYQGAKGACLLPNFLGSLGVAGLMGAIKTDGGPQYLCMASLCRSIEILERDADGNPLLVGGVFRHDFMSRPEIQKEVENQREIEYRAKIQSDVYDAGLSEVVIARAVLRVVRICEAIMRWARVKNKLVALPVTCSMLAPAALVWPLQRYLQWRSDRRADKRWRKLSEPFNPVAAAQGVMASARRQQRWPNG